MSFPLSLPLRVNRVDNKRKPKGDLTCEFTYVLFWCGQPLSPMDSALLVRV